MVFLSVPLKVSQTSGMVNVRAMAVDTCGPLAKIQIPVHKVGVGFIHAAWLKLEQIDVAAAGPRFCAVGATVTPPCGATTVTPKAPPWRFAVQAA
ncbi:hypothetical protein M7I_3325 [Glarea lozoyensis 74030]|uniref:Uncharacterized protein n=1 Tax=Glarea lozoyensis (strain ATCC 74030 / MF5533) TaxID=1104152 RepID=H0EL66_GLAL7|nr:hypothetical protein M7I_3325 [Glarea lozoyensis 74030]